MKVMRPMLAFAMLGIVACGRNLDLDENRRTDGGSGAVEEPADMAGDGGGAGSAEVDAAQPGKWACEQLPKPVSFRTREECEADRASKGCRTAVQAPNAEPCNVAEGDAYFCALCQDPPVAIAGFSYFAYLCRCEPTTQ